MRFSWNEAKNESNINKHGIDFNDVTVIFKGITITIEDDRFDYPERRFVTFGMIFEHVIVVVHTESETEIRILSARKATKNEQREYFKQISL
jgi:uncharacterized DUF497 family protein